LGDAKSVKELGTLYREVYGVEAKVECKGTLDELHKVMTAAFQKELNNRFAWMGIFYCFWMANGATKLKSMDNDHYPTIKPTSTEEFLKLHTKETVGNSYFTI
jgi:hypothetical protein